MRYIITLFAFLILNVGFSKETTQKRNNLIENKISILDKKVNSIEMNYSKNISREYKDLNDLYYNGFTILIALFGAIFPLLFYIFQFKPAQDALKQSQNLLLKFEENFENRFDEHMKKRVTKTIDQAIESFENLEEQTLPTHYTNLESLNGETASKLQILRLIGLLKRTDVNKGDKDFFARLLTYQNDDAIEKYFVDLVATEPNDRKFEYCATYFAINSKTEYLDLISEPIIKNNNLSDIFSKIFKHSPTYACELLNNKNLVNNSKKENIISFFDYLKDNERNKFEKIKNTSMSQKYSELKAEEA
ncbi:hypothetical protein B0A79_19980 [Flavobacterium piscis]|uniref:HEAT repeat domain-containing protein n=1 Tax=Flavobacterium piscis TaxID=1114874 RepID=A0ABX2XK11_9FLAO|nr:hypothetical protein [Flavobacterium piscis]OCB73638.1 hypothetical protein FLP_13230 [Flavobacterium piscis]OXE98460.1 hypothetical protein B0A79_19980 [Flavobacterium piscis]